MPDRLPTELRATSTHWRSAEGMAVVLVSPAPVGSFSTRIEANVRRALATLG